MMRPFPNKASEVQSVFPRYQSYILRCMETSSQMPDQPGPRSTWRFSQQDPKSGVVHNFPNLDALMAFSNGTAAGSPGRILSSWSIACS
jgi:hypothetical protein